jgi:nicotinamide-nucleotide amidase
LESRKSIDSSLICVGSELLRGKINTHSSALSRRLASIGLPLNHEETVGDELGELTAAIRRSLNEYKIVFVTGGLGPTFDDITREAAAAAAGRKLILSEALNKEIVSKFRQAHLKGKIPPANVRQAYLIEGARAIPNSNGTAPGQWLELSLRGRPPIDSQGKVGRDYDRRVLVLLPGPPRELLPMLDGRVLPYLKKIFPASPGAEAHLHFAGVPESVVDQRVRPVIGRFSKRTDCRIDFTILAHLGLVDFDVFVRADNARRAGQVIDLIARSVQRLFPREFYGMDDDYPLEKVVGDLLRRKKATVAVAESCTGGLVTAKLTDIPGSSDYLIESLVTYSNQAKSRELGVGMSLIERFGAVSKEVAVAMAEGVRHRAQAAYGLSITGIAGPGGGTAPKPVGLVHIAVAGPQKTISRKYQFSGNREAVRQRSVVAALELLRSVLAFPSPPKP